MYVHIQCDCIWKWSIHAKSFPAKRLFACVSLGGLCAFGVIARVNPAGGHTPSYNLYSCINTFLKHPAQAGEKNDIFLDTWSLK